MKRVLFLVLMAMGLAGCGKPQVTPLQRKQAANLVSEAHFATNMREWARAEKLYAEAVKLTPDDGDVWLQLGATRRRQSDTSGAKKAYAEAADAYAAAYKDNPRDPELLMQQATALGLLGRMDEAKRILAKVRNDHPNSPEVRSLTDEAFEQMMKSPQMQALAL